MQAAVCDQTPDRSSAPQSEPHHLGPSSATLLDCPRVNWRASPCPQHRDRGCVLERAGRPDALALHSSTRALVEPPLSLRCCAEMGMHTSSGGPSTRRDTLKRLSRVARAGTRLWPAADVDAQSGLPFAESISSLHSISDQVTAECLNHRI